LAVGSDYVRIVITQVHVKDLDLLLRQYVPVIYGSLRFQLGSQRQTVTQVLDPRKDQYATRAGSLSVNRHIFKASPFIDPVIDMTIGVFRIKASDHTPAALRLLTSLSATVQPTLGVAVKFADTLTQGVLGLLEDPRQRDQLGFPVLRGEAREHEPWIWRQPVLSQGFAWPRSQPTTAGG
jgi:hypothetical protein